FDAREPPERVAKGRDISTTARPWPQLPGIPRARRSRYTRALPCSPGALSRPGRRWRSPRWRRCHPAVRPGGSTVVAAARTRPAPSKPLVGLQRDFVDLRFGMFLHFGILTYTGSWSKPDLDIKLFNPVGLDP